MKRLILPRRRALMLSGGMMAGGALAAPMIASGIARAADDWPNKPVRYINVFPPGGPTDTLSRIVCHELAELTGQQFIVDNKSGLGRQCRHRRDRQGGARRLHDRPLHHRLAVDRADALRQAAVRRRQGLHRHRHAVVGAQHADGAARPAGQDGARADRAGEGQSRQVLLRLVGRRHHARTSPARCSSSWPASTCCTCPTSGSAPAYQDLLAGQVDMMFDNIPGPLGLMRGGKVRGVAVTSQGAPSRGARHPDHGRDPAGLRDHLVGRHLRPGRPAAGDGREVLGARQEGAGEPAREGGVRATDAVKKAFDQQGATAFWMNPADTAAYRAADEKRLAPVIKASGAKVD